MKLSNSDLDRIIGKTPLVSLSNNLFAKLETYNPTGFNQGSYGSLSFKEGRKQGGNKAPEIQSLKHHPETRVLLLRC